MALDPLMVKAISIGLALMFLFAAVHKLRDATAFRVTLIEYQILPDALVTPAARVVPVAELLLGVSWLLGHTLHSVTAIASATLLGIYAVAIGVNLARGRVHFDCGCGFGGRADNEQYLTGGLILRNLALIAAALMTLLPVTARALRPGDYLVLGAAILASTLLFTATNQLLTNRAAIDSWRKKP